MIALVQHLQMATNSCLSDDLLWVRDNLALLTYTIAMPPYFLIGMGGNILMIIAFYKQSKKEKTYAYQVFLTVSRSLEILFITLFMTTFKWGAGIDTRGSDWFKKIYFLMFYSVHVAVPVFIACIMMSLYLSVAMAADRVFALAKPLVYKNINHGRHQIAAVICCVILAVSVSAFETKVWRLDPYGEGENATFVASFDHEYQLSTVAIALGNLRVAVRIFGILTLIALNMVMVYISHKRTQKVASLTSTNDKKAENRKAAERSLLVLTIVQSWLMVFSHLPHTCHLVLLTAVKDYGDCHGQLVAASVDFCIEVADMVDLFVIIIANKRIRRMVLETLAPCKKTIGS